MPIVLSQNEKSAAGVVYADQLGVSYEYPSRYRHLVQKGEKFVYYRGKRRQDNSFQVPHYFGTGIIGDITSNGDGLYRCAILDYRAFDPTVPLKVAGKYLEPEANKRPSREVGLHYQTGVRKIDQDTFDAICRLGGLGNHDNRDEPKPKLKKIKAASANDVEKLALLLALAECHSRWPSAKPFLAPPGGPFSIAVSVSKSNTQCIAVKATAEPEPYISLTTDEVQYSRSHATDFSLWVYYEVDVVAGTAQFIAHHGPITDAVVDLDAALHGGRLRTRDSGKRVGPISG